MNANQVSEMAGVSVRTLHHYDAIGLLCPGRNPENGYREYREEDLDTLQQILFFRACGFTLSKIKALLARPDFDRQKAFVLQKKALEQEKKRIDSMLATLEKSMQNMKGQINMSAKEKFSGFDFSQNPYEEEARRLWGDDVVNESNARIAALPQREQEEISAGMDNLFKELAKLKDEDPAGESAQQAMEKMFTYFNTNFGNHYTPEAFAGLGEMYVADERFTKNIDAYGAGLAAFLSRAMKIYGNTH